MRPAAARGLRISRILWQQGFSRPACSAASEGLPLGGPGSKRGHSGSPPKAKISQFGFWCLRNPRSHQPANCRRGTKAVVFGTWCDFLPNKARRRRALLFRIVELRRASLVHFGAGVPCSGRSAICLLFLRRKIAVEARSLERMSATRSLA